MGGKFGCSLRIYVWRRLFAHGRYHGRAGLGLCSSAGRHGWFHYRKGAWEGEAPDFADELARVRLRILERRGQYKAYLNLAQAEGEFMLYLHMLAKRGQSDLAMAEARQYLTHPTNFHALSRTLAAASEQAKALQLAQDGGRERQSRAGRLAVRSGARDGGRRSGVMGGAAGVYVRDFVGQLFGRAGAGR